MFNLFSTTKKKPGLIRKLFIYKQIERVQAGELVLNKYLSTILDELLIIKPNSKTQDRINFLFQEEKKLHEKLKELEDKKKKLFFKLR